MPLPVTALYAGLLGLWVLYLAFAVIKQRRAHKVSIGSGGVKLLEEAMRAHGNAVETVPLAILLLALSESLGTPALLLHLAGLGLLAGRVLHGYHFLNEQKEMKLRLYGMVLTVTVIAVLSVGLVGHGLAGILS
ncbi:MAG: MAPEG family protein [Pseudomonadota bacterium]